MKEFKNIRINLFDLIDEDDKKPGNWIMAKGSSLNEFLKPLILKLSFRFGSKRKFTKYLENKFSLSQSTSQRFVFLMKDWHPLFLLREISELLNLNCFEIQKKIDFLKPNQPPLKVSRAVKELSEDLCKIIGAHVADGTLHNNFFRISEGYKSNIYAFKSWFNNVFGINYPVIKVSDNEWSISFHNKIFCRYLRKVFDFPSGVKQYTVSEPEIIKKSSMEFRRAFALGALTFEAGISMKNQVELCVSSKAFRDSISEILHLYGIQHNKMKERSAGYWRLWSNNLSKEKAVKWMKFFEPNTEKWLKLKDYVYGFQGKVNSFEEGTKILNKIYPPKPSSKVSLGDVLLAIRDLRETYRYELASYLCERKGLDCYGGRWGHSLYPHLDVLKRCEIIHVKRKNFGKKRSFGPIIRDVYVYNPSLEEWKVPLRSEVI
jgi:hypothetical protein